MSNKTEHKFDVRTERDWFAPIYRSALVQWSAAVQADLPKDQRLGGTAMLVYVALSIRADRIDHSSFPSLDTIAADTGASRRAVADAIKALQSRRLIDIEQRRNQAGHLSNRYTIRDTAVQNLHSDTDHIKVQNLPDPSAKSALPSSAKSALELKNQRTTSSQGATPAAIADTDDDRSSSDRWLRARWASYWEAFAQAKGLSGPQKNSERGRAFADLKRAFPDEASMDALPIDVFQDHATAYALRNKPEFVTVARVIASIPPPASETPPIDIEPYFTVYCERLKRSDRMVIGDERDRVRECLRSLLDQHRYLEPKHIAWAVSWGWKRDHQCPTADRLGFTVRQWIKAGMPETRMAQRTGES